MHGIRLTLVVFLSALLSTASAHGELFTGLGFMSGGSYSRANAVSADGTTIVGTGDSSNGTEAFRWTIGSGMQGLNDLSGGVFHSEAFAVSSDGSVIVGRGTTSINGGLGEQAFRWTQVGGIAGLGYLTGDPEGENGVSYAYGVSGDGTIVVGRSDDTGGLHSFQWTSSGGMVGLGDLSGPPESSEATAVSNDGSVIVGHGEKQDPATGGGEITAAYAVRWTSGPGSVNSLGSFYSQDGEGSNATAVSADGGVIVGYGSNYESGGTVAFRWTESGGFENLGDLAGGATESKATAVSADGGIVVGRAIDAAGSQAFIWDSTHGMRNLYDVLVNDYGLGGALSGWTLEAATGISADGTKIVGYGTGLSGTEAWMVDLAPVPEPTSLLLVAMLGTGSIGRRFYRRRTSPQ